jgi:uncharacterized membrane protein YuzA (DUF378 family)
MKHIIPALVGVAVFLLMRALVGESSWFVQLGGVLTTGFVAFVVIILLAKRNAAKTTQTRQEESDNG